MGRRPLPNRVRPDGELEAVRERGRFLGYRGGRIHDPATQRLTARRWASRAWICCLLEFRGRRRQVWGDGYTELFFLDEVTALAAGHRPCFECRRGDARAYADAVAGALGAAARPSAVDLDRCLQAERLDGRRKRLHRRELAALPDGAMVVVAGGFFAVRGAALLEWSPGGYRTAEPRPAALSVDVLTPPTSVAALAGGFLPAWHPTAEAIAARAGMPRAGGGAR